MFPSPLLEGLGGAALLITGFDLGSHQSKRITPLLIRYATALSMCVGLVLLLSALIHGIPPVINASAKVVNAHTAYPPSYPLKTRLEVKRTQLRTCSLMRVTVDSTSSTGLSYQETFAFPEANSNSDRAFLSSSNYHLDVDLLDASSTYSLQETYDCGARYPLTITLGPFSP